MRCKMPGDGSWRVEVVGCKMPTGVTVPVNTSHVDDNYEWKCTMSADGKVTMHQGVNPNAKCGDRHQGEQWRDKSFIYECGHGGQQKLVACVGENEQRINVGETKEISGYLMKCEHFPNGTVMIHGARKDLTSRTGSGTFKLECVDSKGKQHAPGTWWLDNYRFNKTCLPTGKVDVVNCVSKNGHKVPVNQEVIIDDTKYICEKTKDGAIRFASGPTSAVH